MREVSCDAPRLCPKPNCSSSTTSTPRRASCQAVALPSPPAPTTTVSTTSTPASVMSDLTEPRQQPTPDVQAGVLHRCEPALGETARGHAPLHRLTDRPVLLVDDVPEVGGVGGVKGGTGDFVGCEQQVADDARLTGRG